MAMTVCPPARTARPVAPRLRVALVDRADRSGSTPLPLRVA